jgi:uncharacterized protein (TIGR02145 family)
LLSGKGTWQSGVAYNLCDVVIFNGDTFACSQSHTSSGTIDTTNSTYWTQLSIKGDTGTTGPTGSPGQRKGLSIGNVVTGADGSQQWLDRNLGASQVATSSNDADAYGDLYQWGRGSDGHESRTSPTTTVLSPSDSPGHDNFIKSPTSPYDWRSPKNDNLWQGVSGINNPCPAGFRLPTETEWMTEYNNWTPKNSAGAFASNLKLVMAGDRILTDGAIERAGSSGYYWSSTATASYAHFLFFSSGSAYIWYTDRAYGESVRCLKD